MPYKLMRMKQFPRIHVLENRFQLSAENTLSGQSATIVPTLMYDEGLGSPSSVKTNPENGSFAEANEPNCYPDSRINFAKHNLEFALTKGCWNTDKIESLKVAVIPIALSFVENYTALNDNTSEEVEDILELQHETTDRQGYPLYNGTKLNGDFPDIGTNMPGLTTNTNIEGVAFGFNKFYDAIQYFTNAGKIKKSIGKVRWINVSRRRNFRMQIRIKSKSKRMNPYTFAGVLIAVPHENNKSQMMVNGDLTAIDHLIVKSQVRFNEWNDNFDFER
jgi:hypothetical protein